MFLSQFDDEESEFVFGFFKFGNFFFKEDRFGVFKKKSLLNIIKTGRS